MEDFRLRGDVCKVDESLGLVFGYAIVCKQDGEPYFDTQGDHIPEDAMLRAAADFAKNAVHGDLHERRDGGSVVFMFPLTSEVAKSFGLSAPRTGLLIAVRPSPEVLEKFRNGTYTGFSIGGRRELHEVVEA